MDNKNTRAVFTTRIGAVAAAVGSAVGLGNIWRFPYEAGSHGGGAFMLCYIAFIFLIGFPVICAEFIMGRQTRSNEFRSFRTLAPGRPGWSVLALIGILSSVMILGFYSVVVGWTVEYIWLSISGELFSNAGNLSQTFATAIGGGWRPVFWTFVFLLLNYIILSRGVQKGIEKLNNILMPLMFVLLIVLCVNSLFMPGASEGLKFLFLPDFSKLTPDVVLSALGQSFFSLSIGVGTMLTYASYFSADTRLAKTAFTTSVLDTLVAILAGVMIFPAVFSFGMQPAQGLALVYEVLPQVFRSINGGMIWASIFFFLLFLASISSTISMSEIQITFLIEELKLSRRGANLTVLVVAMILGTVCALSFGPLKDATLFGKTFFDLLDYVASNIFMPACGMFLAFFVGWKLDKKIIRKQLSNNGSVADRAMPYITFCLKWIAPLTIFLVMLNSIDIL